MLSNLEGNGWPGEKRWLTAATKSPACRLPRDYSQLSITLAAVVLVLVAQDASVLLMTAASGYCCFNSAFHHSGVAKWVPALAGKAKAGMVHSVDGWTRGVQVKLRDPLRTHAIPERLRGAFTTRRLPYFTLPLLMHLLTLMSLFNRLLLCAL